MKFLEEAPLTGKRALVRVVADVPLEKSKTGIAVADDYRLRLLLPTIHYLLDYGAKVILISHLGRPGGRVDESLSLRPVWQRLAAMLRRPIQFAPTLLSDTTAEAVKRLESGEILALENLRFTPGEEKNSRTFAAQLARYADLFVNDAFAVSHHQAASLDAITELLPSYGGLLLEREVKMLAGLMQHPSRPYIAVVGGAKISDKLPAIKQLLNRADHVLVGGGVANTFMAASGVAVRNSLIDADCLDQARLLHRQGRGRILLPSDFVWKKEAMVDIGPKTQEKFARHLKSAKTIFWSGPLGKVEERSCRAGSEEIARAIVASGATSIVGGGDTVTFVDALGLTGQYSFVSSGGGATLAYLGGQTLVGLKALD